MKEISNLKTNKATPSTEVPIKSIKENYDIFGDFIFENFNNSLFCSIFLSPMKNAIITPAYKKGTKACKDNYRPVTILSNISKIHGTINV